MFKCVRKHVLECVRNNMCVCVCVCVCARARVRARSDLFNVSIIYNVKMKRRCRKMASTTSDTTSTTSK